MKKRLANNRIEHYAGSAVAPPARLMRDVRMEMKEESKRRRISSDGYALYMKVLYCVVTGGMAIGSLIWLFRELHFGLGMCFVTVWCGVLFGSLLRGITHVEMDAENLYIATPSGEAVVPRSLLSDVSQMGWQTPQIITVVFSEDTSAGRKAKFIAREEDQPTLFGRHPIVAELQKTINSNKTQEGIGEELAKPSE